MFRFLVWWRKFHFYRIILDWKNTLEKRFKKKIPAVVFFWCQETCLFFNPQSKGEFNHSFISPSIWTSAVFWVVSISSPIRELRISGSPHGRSPHIWHHTFDIYTSLVMQHCHKKNYPTSVKVLTYSTCFISQSHLENVFCDARHVSWSVLLRNSVSLIERETSEGKPYETLDDV